MSKLWGGRFTSGLDPVMEKFNASIEFDQRLWKADIDGSIAYAKALFKANLLKNEEMDLIVDGLKTVEHEWKCKQFIIQSGDEDIHSANERRLKELIGVTIGGKLHTGRSRNDQVATDMKLWLRESLNYLKRLLQDLIQILVSRSKDEIDVIIPGYTHLQRAQPILWSHWLMNYAWIFRADFDRLQSSLHRLNSCPLGSGALAGNPFSIDRDAIAAELNFDNCTPNSMYAVSDRDFIAEFHFWSSLLSVHLSKLAEDLIIYSTKEFNFVTLADEFTTGSSLMPQKKNADSLELIRGKSGRIIGNNVGLLIVLKGLPSTFNKDLQEDKEGMFDTYDNVHLMLQVATGTIRTLTLNKEKCSNALSSEMLSTDIAYYLVRKGLPFRSAHETAGKVVSTAETLQCDISQVPLESLKQISSLFTEDVLTIWNYEHSIDQYQAKGGTSRASVKEQISNMDKWLLEEK